VAEPARALIPEHQRTGGEVALDERPEILVEQLILRSIDDYTAATRSAVTVFDRGVPDCVAYAMPNGLDLGPASDAASRYPYEEPVFAAGLWEEIWRPQLHAWVTAA